MAIGNGGGGNSSGEAAVLIFVIIGAVILAIWTLYVTKYLYGLAAGYKPCDIWYDLSFSSASLSESSGQTFDFNGLHFATGFRDGNTDVGIAVELGHTDILLTETNSLALDRLYWFLGPVLRWRLSDDRNPHYFNLSFMVGSTEHDEVGVLGGATLGLRFGIGDYFHLGFNAGVMSINLNDNKGLVSENAQYHSLYGVSTGIRF